MNRHTLSHLSCVLLVAVLAAVTIPQKALAQLKAGAAKVDITDREAGPVSDPMYARAVVIQSESKTVVLVSVDAVALGEIGRIDNGYLARVREALKERHGIDPSHVVINASHCHGVIRKDVDQRTVQAVEAALAKLEPVKAGVGTGFENRIMENRRLKLKDGTEIDVRHAYSMPPDEEVAEVGPIDPEIGVLKLERNNGSVLAVIYNFACHPIQGVPSGGNTADITGFSSQVIEDTLGEDCIALFVQGCAGDINPISYKAVDHPRDAEPLGNQLALSTLRALRTIKTQTQQRLVLRNEPLELPRADLAQRIVELEAERERLLKSLRGTSLNLKTFIPLVVKYNVHREFPSYYSHRYLHEEAQGKDDYAKLDAENRRNMKQYIANIYTMERLTRVQTNLRLLNKHQASLVAGGKRTLDVEVVGLRVGDFVLLTFPGELTVRIGLNLKKSSPHPNTFVAGYTNGYIYYAPTAEQLKNVGNAQEDSDCLLAPEWQAIFESKANQILNEL